MEEPSEYDLRDATERFLTTRQETSLRDQFAMAALSAIITAVNQMPGELKGHEEAKTHIATTAYGYADAMLKARGEQL